MGAILLTAVLFGISHALEVDHVAAVSSLISGKKKPKAMIAHGMTWGLGHALTLFIVCCVALAFGKSVSGETAKVLDFIVGLMLIMLGGHVLLRVVRDRMHIHIHSHSNERPHFHLHSHQGEAVAHHQSFHDHQHTGFQWRTLLVGITHGMAGSAVLIVMVAAQFQRLWQGMLYVLLFGLGTLIGMVVVTAALSVPLSLAASFLVKTNRWLQAAVGAFTMLIGISIAYGALLMN